MCILGNDSLLLLTSAHAFIDMQPDIHMLQSVMYPQHLHSHISIQLCQLFNLMNGYSLFPDSTAVRRVSAYTCPVLDQQTQPHFLNSLPTPLCFKTPVSLCN